MTEKQRHTFQTIIWDYYQGHGRHTLLWRQPEANGSYNPYKILVSELMLQQTQVNRVTVKYLEFLQNFPTIEALAAASLSDVLTVWQGLGYNRRAKFLWQAAQQVIKEENGTFPATLKGLISLPGVGVNTAGAIMAYAFNTPVVFIETNVRTVFIHHFFKDDTHITDAQIRDLVEQTLPEEHTREWYWALMDYGTYVKQTVGNLARSSSSYVKQSKFEGSKRQIRGQVIKLLSHKSCTLLELQTEVPDDRLRVVLADLIHENLIMQNHERYTLFH